MARLDVNIGALKMKNPVMTASGTFGYGLEFQDFVDLKGIECEVSLENLMACGLGACLCCVEKTTEGNLCVCKDGPVFNINRLLWQN